MRIMTGKTTHWLYGAAFAVSVLFFGYVLFPEDRVKDHMLISWAEIFPELDLSIQSLAPSLPLSAKMKGVQVRLENGFGFDIPFISVGYNILSSLGSMRSYSFKADGYDGKADGTFAMTKKAPARNTANIHLSGIRMETIEPVQKITNGLFSGLLSGEITHDSGKGKDPTFLNLVLSDCKMPVKLAFLDLGVMEFKDVLMDAALTGQNFEIRKCTLKGVQADGDFAGQIAFHEDLNRSRLNLSGTINLHHEFLKTLPQNQAAGNLMTRNGIRFTISGTFEQPKFSLR